MPIYNITLANKIKNYRNENNLSQKDFGKLLGVSAQAVYKWEHEMCYPDIIILPYIANLLNCCMDDFFEERYISLQG